MIRKSDEMTKQLNEKMRGGDGVIEITHIFKQEDLKGKARLCAKITVNPGCSIGLHEHDNEEEIFYVIRGRGIIDDNGEKREVSVGDAVLTGGGATHMVENNESEPLEMLAVILLYV